MKTTNWFGSWQAPLRTGWYQILVWLDDEPLSVALARLEWQLFDGRNWMDGLSPRMAWRGLLSDPLA